MKNISRDIVMTDVDAFKNNSGSVILNQLTGEAIGVLTNSKKGLSFSSLDGCRETISHPEGDHQTLAFRLDSIPYLKKNFFPPEKLKGFQVQGLKDQQTLMVLKFRSPKNNQWTTHIIRI